MTSSPLSHRGITRLELVSNNLDEQEKFYSKQMELPVTRISNTRIKVNAGSTEIFFYEDKNYIQPIYHFAFNIPENQLNDGISWLKKHGITIAKRPDGSEIYNFSNWNAHAAYWIDASGNLLEFIARHNLPTASNEAFSSKSILYASEIGLVVDSVSKEIDNIDEGLSLKPFKGYASNFAAIGNEHNLLIIVERNRPWLGSTANIPANPVPVNSTFAVGNKETSMKFKNYPFTITTHTT